MSTSRPEFLRNALRSRNEFLAVETDALVRTITPLLWHTIASFPTGTSHTPDHTTIVEHIAGMLVEPGLIRELSDDELQLLILACHFHDLGMAGTESENQTARTREQLRRDHAIRIGEIISANWKVLGIRNQTLADLLAEVCRGHRPVKTDGIANWQELRQTGIVAPGRSVRLRTISAIIYAADELHIGADRAPKREEDWLQIENEESRRHWKRHQCVEGPVVERGELTFHSHSRSFVVESDLIHQVFRKALSAVEDANRQLKSDELVSRLPKVTVHWLRHELWHLLLLRILSDHIGRTRQELFAGVMSLFQDAMKASEDQAEVMLTGSMTENDENELHRTIADWCTQSRLRDDDVGRGTFLLSTERRHVQWFFSVVRNADSDDVLFAGRYAAHHEFDFLNSTYGREMVGELLFPVVERGFGVDLSIEQQESALLTAMKASPTAIRLLLNIAPAPSVLVKRHLLRLLVLSGFSLDLFHKPELILNSEWRRAAKRLSNEIMAQHLGFLALIEELALVGGYNYDQIHQAIISSDAANAEHATASGTDVKDGIQSKQSFTISQTIDKNIPAASAFIPFLWAAGVRAGVPVEILNTTEAPLSATLPSNSSDNQYSPPTRIVVGPGKRTAPTQVDVRASFSFDEQSGAGELLLYETVVGERRRSPIIVGLPAAAIKAGNSAETHMAWDYPAVTVLDVMELRRCLQKNPKGTVEWRVLFAKTRRLFANEKIPCEVLRGFQPTDFSDELIDSLYEICPEAPLPWWVSSETASELEKRDRSGVEEMYRRYKEMNPDDKKALSSLFVKTASAEGHTIREEFLGMFPKGMFNPPVIAEVEGISQEDVSREWRNPQLPMSISAYFDKDYQEIAGKLRAWSKGETAAFPLEFRSGPPDSPVFKTRGELAALPHIDRTWYLEQPFEITLRPMTKNEQWKIELGYWDSVGDQDRVDLLRERIEDEEKRDTAKS